VALHSVARFYGRSKLRSAPLVEAGGDLPIIVTFVNSDEHVKSSAAKAAGNGCSQADRQGKCDHRTRQSRLRSPASLAGIGLSCIRCSRISVLKRCFPRISSCWVCSASHALLSAHTRVLFKRGPPGAVKQLDRRREMICPFNDAGSWGLKFIAGLKTISL